MDDDRVKARILSVISDVALQLKQSRRAQRDRQADLALAQNRAGTALTRWKAASERYSRAIGTPDTALNSRARSAAKRVGYIERQIADLDDKAALVSKVSELSASKKALAEEKSQLQDNVLASERAQEVRKRTAYTRLAENTKAVLREDLERQDTFHRAERVSFDFTENRVSVEGESFFSASSMVYLKNAFLTAFLLSAIQDQNFRHPRFLMLDTVEDKGMEPPRSHNFQRVLKDISDSTDTEHQVIIATAMIAPEFAETSLVVGRHLTHEHRSLQLPQS